MPLLLRCAELQPWMRLHDPIVVRGRTILPAGKELTHADVDSLRVNYPQVPVRVCDSALDDVVEFEDDTHDREVAQNAQQRVLGAMSQVSERFTSRAALNEVNFGSMQESILDVMRYLRDNPVSAALLARSLDPNSYLTEHAANVFYLSMLLGAAVRDCVKSERARRTQRRATAQECSIDLAPLGLGAMFIDLGMYPLQYLFKQEGLLSRTDRLALAEHPQAGVDMLPDSFSPLARMIVRTHHENYNGTGYPDRLTGDATHIFTRIVRIADAFDAATAQHIYKKAKTPARALWEMVVGVQRRYYDPVLMKLFARLIQPFPIGGRLRLQDGRYAVVVKYNRENAFMPTVLVAFDAYGDRLPTRQLGAPFRLDQQFDVRVQSFAGEDLSYLYDKSYFEALAPVRGDFTTMYEAAFP